MYISQQRTLFLFSQGRYFPKAHAKFSQVKNLGAWPLSAFDALEGVVRQIEAWHGRLRVSIS
jgi:hypothetical protein